LALAKVRDAGLATRTATPVAVPLRETVRVTEGVRMERVPVRVPTCVGVNVTEMAQVLLAPMEVPQELEALKAPLAETLVMGEDSPPVLERMTCSAAEVEPIAVAGKMSEVGLTERLGPETPVPERPTD
jgi:hypothetical protein